MAILAVSAAWDHRIVWLHFFQALQYVAVIALAARGSRWGYFLGIAVAAFWNYSVLFVNSFFRSGMRAVLDSLHQGAIVRPDQMIAVAAFLFHLILIAACIAAYLRLPRRPAADAGRLIATFCVAILYFAAIVALFQPRYLTLFPRLLHPHGLF
jgi:glucan phosphoethanolaminetransferase (alkaline phosphatase superfamily)